MYESYVIVHKILILFNSLQELCNNITLIFFLIIDNLPLPPPQKKRKKGGGLHYENRKLWLGRKSKLDTKTCTNHDLL